MPRLKLDSDLLRMLIERVPEGFIHISTLTRHAQNIGRKAADSLLSEDVVRDGEYLYQPTRMSVEQLHELRDWARPEFPLLDADGQPLGVPIAEARSAREALRNSLPDNAADLLARLEQESAYINPDQIAAENLISAASALVEAALAGDLEGILFDPLRFSKDSIRELLRRDRMESEAGQFASLLSERDGATMAQEEAINLLGEDKYKQLIGYGGFSRFSVTMRTPPYSMTWVRLRDADFRAAQEAAQRAVTIPESAWTSLLAQAGEQVRPGARKPKTARGKLSAHTFTTDGAAKRLDLHADTIEDAAESGLLAPIIDPEGVMRFSASEIERILRDTQHYDLIAALESVDVRALALMLGSETSILQHHLRRAHLPTREVTWGQVRNRWGLPERLPPFKDVLREKLRLRKADREAAAESKRLRAQEERQRREDLRERLVASFPAWRHGGRAEQRMILHIGPPNSGKTHHALNALAASSGGWYLAPLRLLAFEVFERLNQRGVRCNLLTGEEFIPVDGATITAATIEMFNPQHSGECVVIDEAQMLADSDRGWAWTRALMEAQASSIHVLAPPSGRALIERLARAAELRLTVQKHERLAEIKVADEPWSVRRLPPRTILVAFSRHAALRLKTNLERSNRSVSIVYGNLPPEVRRRQADRFAHGETEICVATDAVGMGLNLPADYVCFYEVQKFDGRQVRLLTAAEVQQIGGRAGRFGLSQAG
ncbi:MAG TPA: helicase-related protein, partial [Candidatus Limnocylindrales bacterium]|nr:helicase-related protein [Candidatus Limnocylindrales bacterium]